MCILSYSFMIIKIKFVKRTDLPHSLGPVIMHLIECFGYRTFSIIYY